MTLYTYKNENVSGKSVVLDDLFLTKDMPTAAGSKMLDKYMSLFDAEIIGRLAKAGYAVKGKANVGEFSLDLMGETSCYGACEKDGVLTNASAEILNENDTDAVIAFDTNGTPRRVAALNGKFFIKPTYGVVSRFGTIPVVCSGEVVSVMANDSTKARDVLDSIIGHDDKDGTSLPAEKCDTVKSGSVFTPVTKIAVAKSICDSADDGVKAQLDAFKEAMSAKGIEFTEVDDEILTYANTAYNILMAAELCNNVSRYDGVKYGYRTKNYKTIEELYTNSRSESFGDVLKTTILFGSETLSDDNYMKVYDKSQRVRRVISEKFAEIFSEYGAVLMPACGKTKYTVDDVKANKYLSFDEGLYTAPSSITGLPAMVIGGVQLVAPAFGENALFDLAEKYKA